MEQMAQNGDEDEEAIESSPEGLGSGGSSAHSLADPGAEPGADPGAEPGADPGAEPGADPRAEPGADPGAEPGADPAGAEPGADPGAEPRADPGAEPRADVGADAGAGPSAAPLMSFPSLDSMEDSQAPRLREPGVALVPREDSDDEVEVMGATSAFEGLSLEELQARFQETSEQLRQHKCLVRDWHAGFGLLVVSAHGFGS